MIKMSNSQGMFKAGRFLLAAVVVCLFGGITTPVNAGTIDLTEEEQAYINETVVLKAASISGGAPHHYFNSKGEIKGIAVSVLDEIAALTGLKIEYRLYESITDAFSSGADLFFGVSKEYAPPGASLSKPYLKSETILFYNSSLDPTQLEDKKYAAISGGTLPEGVEGDNVLYFDDREDTFSAVETGQADYGFGNEYSLAFYTLQNGYRNIITLPQGKEDRAYCMALLEENDVLLSIINKSIAAIDENRMQTIILGVTAQVERKVTWPMILETYWKQIFAVVFIAIAVLAAAVFSSLSANKKLRSHLARLAEREGRIKYLSFHDKLTGLYNRAYFEEKLKTLDHPPCFPLSIIMGDINGLKLTNDIFGHYTGDKLLQEAASVLKMSCRSRDVIARYGGDEFAIILPETTSASASKICDRIRILCEESCQEFISASISLGWATKRLVEQNVQDVIKEAENVMYHHKILESKSAKNEIITSLESSLHEKNIETREHTLRLRETTTRIGLKLGLSRKEMDDLKLLARLHDIGMITVDERILNKKDDLTENELAEIQKHSEAGYRIAESAQTLSGISRYILHHHERWDGTGYPHGLKGKEIPLLSRILSITDAYDAMTVDRPYRKAKTRAAAIGELIKCSGSQFDPELVTIFISIIDDKDKQLP